MIDVDSRVEEIRGLQEQNYNYRIENDELRAQVCKYGESLEKTEKELQYVKKLLSERNKRYQEDCVTINQLTAAVDVLVERLARKMGV